MVGVPKRFGAGGRARPSAGWHSAGSGAAKISSSIEATVDGLHPDSPGRALVRLAAAAGVPRIRFHDLRHTMATVALAEGGHPKLVQERLGYASAKTTLDHSSHTSAELQRAAADRPDAALADATADDRDQAVTEPQVAG
jgi:integrase